MNSRLRELIRNGVDPRLLHDQSVLHGGKGSAPPAPDYRGAAQEQAAASQEIATQQNYANRPTQYTPWGTTQWGTAAGTDPSTGQPITEWTQTQTLRPELEEALGSQVGLQTGRSDLAQDFMGRVEQDYQQPFDWQNLPAASQATQFTDAPAFADERQRYTDAAFEQMRPEHQRQEEAARTRLANQGLTPGSQAYNTELERLGGVQAQERWNAVNQGGVEQQRMNQQLMSQQAQAYQQQNLLRQQGISEQAQRRGMSLNEMNALLTGQQVNPAQMPSFTGATAGQAPQYLAAAGQQGQYGLGAQGMENQQNANLWGGIGSLGSAAAMMYFSDERLKSNIVRVGGHPLGIGIYEYDLFGHRERGVLAQEVLQVAPELVFKHPSGYLLVNYGGL